MPWSDWMATLQRDEIYGIILGRIERVEDGNLGDCEPVGDGVFELKIDFGPGYRIYFGEDDDLVILLWGGKKKTQASDIKIARKHWKYYNA